MMSARRRVCDPIGRVGVVEHDFRPAGPARELAERREQSLFSQIGRDAEPNHKSPPARVEPGGFKRGGHAPALEVMGDIGDVRRFGDLRLREPASLLGLCRRMIELEDAHVRRRLKSVSERVEACAQDQDLPHADRDCIARRILCEPAAHRDEQAQRPPLRLLLWRARSRRRRLARGSPARADRRKRARARELDAPLDAPLRRPRSRSLVRAAWSKDRRLKMGLSSSRASPELGKPAID